MANKSLSLILAGLFGLGTALASETDKVFESSLHKDNVPVRTQSSTNLTEKVRDFSARGFSIFGGGASKRAKVTRTETNGMVTVEVKSHFFHTQAYGTVSEADIENNVDPSINSEPNRGDCYRSGSISSKQILPRKNENKSTMPLINYPGIKPFRLDLGVPQTNESRLILSLDKGKPLKSGDKLTCIEVAGTSNEIAQLDNALPSGTNHWYLFSTQSPSGFEAPVRNGTNTAGKVEYMLVPYKGFSALKTKSDPVLKDVIQQYLNNELDEIKKQRGNKK